MRCNEVIARTHHVCGNPGRERREWGHGRGTTRLVKNGLSRDDFFGEPRPEAQHGETPDEEL